MIWFKEKTGYQHLYQDKNALMVPLLSWSVRFAFVSELCIGLISVSCVFPPLWFPDGPHLLTCVHASVFTSIYPTCLPVYLSPALCFLPWFLSTSCLTVPVFVFFGAWPPWFSDQISPDPCLSCHLCGTAVFWTFSQDCCLLLCMWIHLIITPIEVRTWKGFRLCSAYIILPHLSYYFWGRLKW